MKVIDVLTNLPRLPQAQNSMLEQLWDIGLIADRIGFYNAFNYIFAICKTKNIISRFSILNDIPFIPATDFESIQSSSLEEQLKVLRNFAIKLGLYDADDFLKDVTE